jgi:nucleotide sugar dehydrogenase
MVKIGICGVGFVGQAIQSFFLNNKKPVEQEFHKHEIEVYDKYKNINTLAQVINTNLLYICLPTPFNEQLKTYDLSEISQLLFLLHEQKYTGTILLKSTVTPNYCTDMNQMYKGLKIVHNPEFLSARTAAQDFAQQEHIILGYTPQSQCMLNFLSEFYKVLFPKAIISSCSAEVASLTKLACNSFYATKVQYFTELYELCQRMGISYTTVKDLMIRNNWIHPQHTTVPGPDGQISFGGACLPKDLSALNQYMALYKTPHQVLNAAITERNEMRTL